MTAHDLWAVQYLRAVRYHDHPVMPAEKPRIYKIVAFSGDTVWGINTETHVLTKINRTATDGSERTMNIQAYHSHSEAKSAAERITAQIDAEEAEAQRKADAETAQKRAAQQAMYPAVQPAAEADGPPPAQITSTFTVKTTKKEKDR